MKKLLLGVFILGLTLSLVVSPTKAASIIMKKITVAVNSVNLIVNGDKVSTDNFVYNGTTYVPLRTVSEKLGKEVNFNNTTKTVTISEPGASPSSTKMTQNGVTVEVTKVVQDSDSLRLYVTYTNNSNKEAMTGDSLAKIISNGKQYSYNHDFNFERYYETNIDKADDFIEPGVSEKSVIFFKPIQGVKTINIVLNANFDDYRYNNIPVK
ncbi:stalk domain-containing protein [Peribacillus loiseleuriae]|uniref:stalk domain-containing protein n=1 Tax=Peribacillus loiseleuriae TaxID=1679170 RepID=UPI003812EE31